MGAGISWKAPAVLKRKKKKMGKRKVTSAFQSLLNGGEVAPTLASAEAIFSPKDLISGHLCPKAVTSSCPQGPCPQGSAIPEPEREPQQRYHRGEKIKSPWEENASQFLALRGVKGSNLTSKGRKKTAPWLMLLLHGEVTLQAISGLKINAAWRLPFSHILYPKAESRKKLE